MTRIDPALALLRTTGVPVLALLVLPACGGDGVQPPATPAPAMKATEYEFKPVSITPSANGRGYTGRFLFVNKRSSPVMISGFDKPARGKFEPRFVKFQVFMDEAWRDLRIGYCGTGNQTFAMIEGKRYEYHVDLWAFDEQATPLTGRIGVDEYREQPKEGWVEYWSEPFVLDWMSDRESGMFAAARTEHYKKLRTAFAKAGFKEELLVADDFCSRLLQTMMKEASAREAAGSFEPFVGKLDVTPEFELDGSIRIDFSSDEVRKFDTQYRGWFSLHPRKFTPQWFHNAAKHRVEAGKWGDGIQMELDDGAAFDAPLYLCIKYEPFGHSKLPSEKDAEALFRRMLKVLGNYLRE